MVYFPVNVTYRLSGFKHACTECGHFKCDVNLVDDPYYSEVEGISKPKYLCDACYSKLLQDI